MPRNWIGNNELQILQEQNVFKKEGESRVKARRRSTNKLRKWSYYKKLGISGAKSQAAKPVEQKNSTTERHLRKAWILNALPLPSVPQRMIFWTCHPTKNQKQNECFEYDEFCTEIASPPYWAICLGYRRWLRESWALHVGKRCRGINTEHNECQKPSVPQCL